MSKLYKKSVFIFRRDLRIADNTALHNATQESEQVIPCFIFDPAQVGQENEYRSLNCIQFMINSLHDLEQQLKDHGRKLYLFYGPPEQIIQQLIDDIKIDAVFCNKDYTPFSSKRDEKIEHLCNRHAISFNSFDDALLNPPQTILNQSGTPYAVFTAFYKKASQFPVEKPHVISYNNFYTQHIPHAQENSLYKKILPHTNAHMHVEGGSSEALDLIKKLKNLSDYATTRDIPTQQTSNFAAHLKFGTISVRELYYAIETKLGAGHPLQRQLYWRDFFSHIAYHSPFVFGHTYQQKFDHLRWDTNAQKFERWCSGTTGFPIVDAGMRQLNTTGFMHNRLRMIVASFLTKDLHIDWRMGEKYFAQQLIDYDPAVNNGNWQWCASTGCDAQPYFRIFNPWLQQKKFDPAGEFIKMWIPELKNLPAATLHGWYKNYAKYNVDYPVPMVDHALEAQKTKIWFKNNQN